MKRPPVIPEGEITKYITFLENKIEAMQESPIQKLYLSVKEPVEYMAEQVRTIKIDLNADGSNKTFDRLLKYLVESRTIADNLEHLQSKIFPEDLKKLHDRRKMENLGYAEKIALGLQKKG